MLDAVNCNKVLRIMCRHTWCSSCPPLCLCSNLNVFPLCKKMGIGLVKEIGFHASKKKCFHSLTIMLTVRTPGCIKLKRNF